MSKIVLPTVDDVSAAIADCYAAAGDPDELDIRLQVTEHGWEVHFGDASYDTDHHGYWGAAVATTDMNVHELAEDLIDQVADEIAISEDNG